MTTPFMTPRGHMANLIAKSKRSDPPDTGGVCPLMSQTLQLLPVRYGRVEDLDPSIEMAMPFALQSRPLGFRLIRNGYLYIIDSATGWLHEYSTLDGSVAALLFKGSEVLADRRTETLESEPALVFSMRSVLHVAFSEVQWTKFKCAQVLKVPAEREYFMQRVSFEGVHKGPVRDLIQAKHMAVWLAESSGSWADKPDETSTDIPYAWEHTPLYRQTIVEELTSQVTVAHKHDFLFLAVRDDVGIMRDLANHQDQLVGQIESWAQGGTQPRQVERDYLLGCYIESITQISEADLDERASEDRPLKALLDDLETLGEPERSTTRTTLLDVMGQDNREEAGRYFHTQDLPADLQARLDAVKPDRLSMDDGIEVRAQTIQQYQLEQRFVGTSPAFIARHLKILWITYRQMDSRTRDQLNGAKFGQRGINDLVDRPAMDVFLKQQRAVLQPLNEQLEKVTQDRIDLLINSRLHRAIWYYDVEDSAQVDHALLTEYACLKDLCRSDSATQGALDWLNANPAMSRPMFYAAPLSAQTELGVQFSYFTNAGWMLIKDAPSALARLKQWGAGQLLDTERLSASSQVNLTAAWGTLSPALSLGIQQALQAFLQNLDKSQLPDMDALFRSFPKAAGVAILDAARRENVTFQVASADDLQHLGKLVKDVQANRSELRFLSNEIREHKAKDFLWHRSVHADMLRDQRQNVQSVLAELEKQLANAMSPLGELPSHSTHLQSASTAKPGLTLVFPKGPQGEVRSILENYRNGVKVAPRAGLLGDGAGLLVFVAQAVNLVQVAREVFSHPISTRELAQLLSSLAATVAAGFGAAQGIADTALSAHAAQLAKNLNQAQLMGVHVQMGKLHIGLGVGGYIAGMIAAGMSLNTSYKNWEEAVRNGNIEAQTGAALSMMGNAGFLASNSYGFTQTVQAFRHVLAAEAGSAARTAAWAAAGVRLSTVFFRFNMAGIFFTALELSGSWLFNRHNLSRHDRWLLSTPWGQDPERRQSHPLSDYQKNLRGHIQAPRVEVVPATDTAGRKVLLHFPTLSSEDLITPFASQSASVLLRVGGYEVQRARHGRESSPEQWSLLKSGLEDRLEIQQFSPLTLSLTDVRELLNSYTPTLCDAVLSIQLGHRTKEGFYETNFYTVRFPAMGGGDSSSEYENHKGEQCAYFNIDPALLPQAEN